VQDEGTADRKTSDCQQCHDLSEGGAQAEGIRQQGGQCKGDSQKVEPLRRMDRIAVLTVIQAQLQKYGHQPDCGDDHDREWAEKCLAAGEQDDNCQCQRQRTRSYNGPTAVMRVRIGQVTSSV